MKKRANSFSTNRSTPQGRSVSANSDRVAAADELFSATVRLFHRLTAAAEQLHGGGDRSAGRRGILKGLDRLGPQTVPQMARARPVSRQHIQVLVNQLAEEGLVSFEENPAHKRSSLVALTEKGKAALVEMSRREARAIGGLDLGAGPKELRAAAQALDRVRQAMEGPRWRSLVKYHGKNDN